MREEEREEREVLAVGSLAQALLRERRYFRKRANIRAFWSVVKAFLATAPAMSVPAQEEYYVRVQHQHLVKTFHNPIVRKRVEEDLRSSSY
jgi:hypothetical protein